MKVLFVASECSPFIKTGGLADVVGSLPQALKKQGIDVRVVIPKYRDIAVFYKEKLQYVKNFTVKLSWRNQYCGIEKLEHQGITYYFIDNEYYFGRSGLYGYYDEAERFAFFNKAVLEMLAYIDFQPNILHCHDWQTGLIPTYLRSHYQHYPNLKTVFTIHNLKYQGIFSAEILKDVLGLSKGYFNKDGLEYYGQVSFMKAALESSDIITTVSKTYAREIQTPYYGEGLDGILRARSDMLYGIINGLDYDTYNPADDEHLFVNYKDSLAEKRENKISLQKMLALPVAKEKPMLILISRLVEQKGIDLVVHMLDEILELDLQLVVLGTGEPKYEQAFRKAGYEYPEKVSANITFNEDLANKMYGAADLFLMPSRFEPCGIGQLIALRYLTVPIVRATGGLADTIIPFNKETGNGNGFTFSNYNAHDMYYTLKKALNFYQDETIWHMIIENITNYDFSWQKSAKEYVDLYQSIDSQNTT